MSIHMYMCLEHVIVYTNRKHSNQFKSSGETGKQLKGPLASTRASCRATFSDSFLFQVINQECLQDQQISSSVEICPSPVGDFSQSSPTTAAAAAAVVGKQRLAQ